VSADHATRRRHHRTRRVLRAAGGLLLIGGVVVVLWGLVIWKWGDPVTALYTARKQHTLERQYAVLEKTFAPPAPAHADRTQVGKPAVDRRAVRLAARRYRLHSETGKPLGRIHVPELGLNMIVVAGTDTQSLREGPGWDQRTYLPGEGELVYIAGHRTTYRAPFGHIERLKPGQRIELTLPYGRFVYLVTRSVIVPADDMSRLVTHGREMIALQACHPRFSAKQRYIVYGRLVHLSVKATS
jgi:sortase A